mgnify:CR=1 FL=1
MKTISLLIGNTDNRLTQKEWSKFVEDIKFSVHCCCNTLFFFGGPPNYSEWQNVAFVFGIKDDQIPELKARVTHDRIQYQQTSAAWVEGETEFI